MENLVHRRLVAHSEALFKELEKLGYKEVASDERGIKKFEKDGKFVISGYGGLVLYEMGKPYQDLKGQD